MAQRDAQWGSLMTDGVLFLCHANVCRSRLMEHEFRAAEKAEGDERWPAASAGVAAAVGHSPCEEVVALAAESPLGARSRRADRGAVQLDHGLLQEAGLVITATRAERAEVALLLPAMRSRTYTLREAVALAQIEPLTATTRTGASPGDVLTAFAESLDRHRGSVRAENKTSRSHWLHRRGRADDVDIADAHHRRARDHQRALRTVQVETIALHAQLSAFAQRLQLLGS
ncbi:hypothetical protein E1I21_01975 [Microbacterium oleivorans]|nr:hypothetical protein E1I21_01975 [Microbacterium oleivorans]